MAPSWSFFQPVWAARAISLSKSCEADETAPPVCLCSKISLARASGKLRLSSKDLRWNEYFLAQILQKSYLFSFIQAGHWSFCFYMFISYLGLCRCCVCVCGVHVCMYACVHVYVVCVVSVCSIYVCSIYVVCTLYCGMCGMCGVCVMCVFYIYIYVSAMYSICVACMVYV